MVEAAPSQSEASTWWCQGQDYFFPWLYLPMTHPWDEGYIYLHGKTIEISTIHGSVNLPFPWDGEGY